MTCLFEEVFCMREKILTRCVFVVCLAAFCMTAFAGDMIDEAAEDFRKASKDGDTVKAKAALNMIARSNNVKAMKTLLDLVQKVSKENDELYWAAFSAVAGIDNPETGAELISFLSKNKKKPIAVDLVFILKWFR